MKLLHDGNSGFRRDISELTHFYNTDVLTVLYNNEWRELIEHKDKHNIIREENFEWFEEE